MFIISNVIDKTKINEYLNSSIDILLLGNSLYSSRHGVDFSIDEIKEIKLKAKNKKVYVSINNLYDESKIKFIKETLIQLNEINIDGILFQDYMIAFYKQELNLSFDLIYDPLTLNTNGLTLHYLKDLGIRSFVLSREISIKDITAISKNKDLDYIVQLDGVRYIAQSKRKLISHYKKAKALIDDVNKLYLINPENTEIYNYIYEDHFGTNILSSMRLLSYSVLKDLLDVKIKYGFINGLFLNFDKQIEIVDNYKKAIDLYQNAEAFNKMIDSLMKQVGDTGFYFDQTVYKLEDVKRKDEDERNKQTN